MKVYASLLLLLVLSLTTQAQKYYTGIVVDSATLEALPYVTVSIKNSSIATSTSLTGNFRITANPFDTLMFSFLGYKTIELPLVLEEDALLLRMAENIKMLSEITIRATRMYPNEIADRTRQTPRKMEPLQALQSPFTYFSKTEKGKRKIYRYIVDTNKTQTYVQVITDPDVKEIFTKDYNLSDEKYYELLAKFNETNRTIMYSTSPEEIMETLHAYFKNQQ